MSRLARGLCSLHAGLFVLLAFCAVQQFRHGEAWAGSVFAAASVVPLLAVAREAELADEQRAIAVTAERKARRREWTDEDAAALARLELAVACCERWWTSTGQSHETTCPQSGQRRAA
ncbi:hypothetical protein ACIBKX_32700 [Streptomyces sp. NPDC050658]|uniref:hypothetical protein n=1 Tax=unclassified Streptomyces TaxID=2593676 RepID=UPI003438569D